MPGKTLVSGLGRPGHQTKQYTLDFSVPRPRINLSKKEKKREMVKESKIIKNFLKV